jgi:uncharacterized protein DUF2865
VVSCGGRKIILRIAVIMLALAGGMLISTDRAHAQGLFDVFNKIFGGWLAPQPSEPPRNANGGPFAYCVRLCDGRYFPMSANAGTSPDKLCGAICPASATKVYTGSGIDQASAADGTSYSKLENAFVYRERMVSDCTCTGKEIGGTVAIDIHSDPTLRPGDIVATKDGLMVFTGSKEVPHQTSDFIAAEDYKGLPAGVRRTLGELRVAPKPDRAVADITVSAPAPEPPRLSTFAPQTGRALDPHDTPAAEAFPIFSFPMF